jgi:hypothetical protein
MGLVGAVGALAWSAGQRWLHAFTRMGFWFLAGFTVQLVANYISVLLGGEHNVLATVVFVLGLIGSVAALVLMIDSAAPHRLHPVGPAPTISRLDMLALTVGPFLAVYAVWGLVEEEISHLFVINIALQGLGGYETWSVNLTRIWLYVVLAVVAWVARQLLARLARRVTSAWLRVPGVVFEGLWVVASLLALFTLGTRAYNWLQGRTVWQWAREARHQLLAWLPDLRLPFDLTLPEAVAAAVSWFWGTLLPGLSDAVLLPLLWLALTAIVLGWRQQASGGPSWRSRLGARAATPAWRLAIGAGRLLTSDLRTKYVPVVRALGVVLSHGWRFVLGYLIVATAVETGRLFAAAGLDQLIGPQSPTHYLARWAITDLAVGLVFTPLAVAVYVTAWTAVAVVSDGTRSSSGRSAAPAVAGSGPPHAPEQ